jgi:glutamate dehydrogenase/leucine dehydrogenase
MSIKYKYTIKDSSGTIHTFKTLKSAKASTIGFSAGGLRIINYVRIEPRKSA